MRNRANRRDRLGTTNHSPRVTSGLLLKKMLRSTEYQEAEKVRIDGFVVIPKAEPRPNSLP